MFAILNTQSETQQSAPAPRATLYAVRISKTDDTLRDTLARAARRLRLGSFVHRGMNDHAAAKDSGYSDNPVVTGDVRTAGLVHSEIAQVAPVAVEAAGISVVGKAAALPGRGEVATGRLAVG